MMNTNEDKPPSPNQQPQVFTQDQGNGAGTQSKGLAGWFKNLFKSKTESNLREAIEEYIDDPSEDLESDSTSIQERTILKNILTLRDIKVLDVMIPRADIVAVEKGASQADLLKTLEEKQISRLPVYDENLDNVLGTIHLKDILSVMARGEEINIQDILTDIPIISPSMHVLDLILEMRQNRRHMALVVDEHGGIDGLVTIGDIIEVIVGDIHDEHDEDEAPQLVQKEDGSILVDARLDIEDFEEEYGEIFSEEDREESDTLGGLVCDIAGRVPARGEILTHESGVTFEVLEADPRRVNRLKIRNIPEALVS